MGAQPVNVVNFERAETDRMFATLCAASGGVTQWMHHRAPTPLDQQPVIRMNRDTLYSSSIVDISEGATVTVPDGGDRYVSVMIVNQDHSIHRVIHEPGDHELTVADSDTPYVAVAARILADPNDADDLATVATLQDGLAVRAGAARAFTPPEYEPESFDATRGALLELARGVGGFTGAFGAKDAVDPVMHLLGTAAGWGGLPGTRRST